MFGLHHIFRGRRYIFLRSFRFPSTAVAFPRNDCRYVSQVQSGTNFTPNLADFRIQPFGSKSGAEGKAPARLSQMVELLNESKSRSAYVNEPVPKITIDKVKIGFARSGGAGGQNVNKVNTKVDMRFHVMSATWLPLRIREKVLQMEKNRINKDGELVVSSTRTRTQAGNIEDALEKIQAIIDAAAYVPPAPTEEKIKRIKRLAVMGEQNRLQAKRSHSMKKAARRDKGAWD